jgi:histidinol-phosphate/aromatic aminotransferase/cobyric acid decarboxylase-like protein
MRFAKADGTLIKLDAMENPYALPAAHARERVAAPAAAAPLNRYPDGSAGAVKAALLSTLGLPPDVALMLGKRLGRAHPDHHHRGCQRPARRSSRPRSRRS